MTTKEIIKKNNLAIARRIVNRIRILEILEPSKIHDEIFNQPLKNETTKN
jgi:hypothetical protein